MAERIHKIIDGTPSTTSQLLLCCCFFPFVKFPKQVVLIKMNILITKVVTIITL